MSNIQIPTDIFYKIVLHYLADDHDTDAEVSAYLRDKYNRVVAHNTYNPKDRTTAP